MDRSLGDLHLPTGLREDGWKLEVMFEVFGQEIGQGLEDPPWIEYASEQGLAILTKDFKSLRYRAPLKTVKATSARVFTLANAELSGERQTDYFRNNKESIFRRALKPGPYICKVYESSVERVWP